MAAFYQEFTATRLTEPDIASLRAALLALDPTAGVQHTPGTKTFVLKKATVWNTAQTTAALNAIETAPAQSPQLEAQTAIDTLPIATRAIILTLIDQVNVLRAALPNPLGPITPAQALAAVRAKAATL